MLIAIGTFIGFFVGACYGEHYGRKCERGIAERLLRLAFFQTVISKPQLDALQTIFVKRGDA